MPVALCQIFGPCPLRALLEKHNDKTDRGCNERRNQKGQDRGNAEYLFQKAVYQQNIALAAVDDRTELSKQKRVFDLGGRLQQEQEQKQRDVGGGKTI